uniref:Variant surface glycoprotein 1125.2832 n=1 Tax=Trypanosoma brucei TaxID=5691 RepID=A0A1J0R8X4_9TRYP|nr:variant surface glycoprotein 1125.2832 [Trypanosoma brucei]
MHTIEKTSIILSLLQVVAQKACGQAAEGGALGKASWLPLAKFSRTASQIPGRAVQLLQADAAHVAALAAQKCQCDIYLIKQDDNITQKGWEVLSAAIGAEINNVLVQMNTKIKDAVAATAAMEFVCGHIAEFFKVAAATENGGSAGCLTTNTAGGAAGNVINSFTSLPVEEHPMLDQLQVTPNTAPLSGITLTGFTDLTANTGIHTNALTNNAKCVLFKGTAAGPTGGGGLTRPLPFAGGYLTRHNTPSTKSTSDGTDFTSNQTASQLNHIKIYQNAHAKAAKLLPTGTFKGALTDYKHLSQAKQSLYLRTAVKNLLLNKPDSSVADLSSDIDQKINQVFGEDQPTFHSRFWDQLKKVKVEKAASGQEETTLDAITSFAALSRARTYYSTKFIKDLRDRISSLEIKNSETEVKVTDEDCKKYQSSDKCTEPCKWDDNVTDKNKKCSLDPVKVAKQQVTHADTGEGAAGEPTTEECKGKKQKDCKSPDCKWDGKECKAYSILISKNSPQVSCFCDLTLLKISPFLKFSFAEILTYFR